MATQHKAFLQLICAAALRLDSYIHFFVYSSNARHQAADHSVSPNLYNIRRKANASQALLLLRAK